MDSIQVQVLGAGCDIGKSCVVAKMGSVTVMYDCGVHPGFGDTRRFPNFESIPNLSELSLILISHFHLDHAAALPLLTEIHRVRAPVYMTEPTRELARLMLVDFIRTSRVRNQHCPFSEDDAAACLARVRLIGLDAPLSPPGLPGVEVTAYHAGHALGAAMFRVAAGARTMLYSGDYATCGDGHLRAARFAPHTRPHLFVTEATYCGGARARAQRGGEEEDDDAALAAAVAAALAAGGRVLVPVSAFGRAQQVAAALGAQWGARAPADAPVYVADGLLARASAVCARFPSWRADLPQCGPAQCGTGDEPGPRDLLRDARPFNRAQHWGVVTGNAPAILFATPSNLATGLSRDVFRAWASDPRNLVVVPSFSVESTLAGEDRPRGAPGAAPQVRCRIMNLSFSSHADAPGIRKTIEALRPDNIMLVHGDREKVKAFQKSLTDEFQCPVFAPENGDVVDVQCPPYDEKRICDESVTVEEDKSVNAYLKGPMACVPGFTGLGYGERKMHCKKSLWAALEKTFGQSMRNVGKDEYCLFECITVTSCEEEKRVLVEWGDPSQHPKARKVLKAIDDLATTRWEEEPATEPT